jgi:hypothetical protein
MEMEQMMAHLLAEIRTDQEHMKKMMNKMKDKIKDDMKTMQEKAEANRETNREERKAERKADREDLKEMMEEMMNANLKEMSEEIKSGQVEIRSIVNACIANMRDDRKETMSCLVMTEACLDSKGLNPEDRIRSGTSRGPYGRGRSEIFKNNEEAAQRPTSSCKAMR